MSKLKYITKTLWERNANNGIDFFDRIEDALESAAADHAAGAVNVDIYECRELEIEYQTRAVSLGYKE